MVRGDQSVMAADTRRGGMQTCVSVCTPARGHLPVRLVSERLDETGAAVRFAGLRGPSLLWLELEGLVSSMVPGGPGWEEAHAPEVPVTPLPPGLWSPPRAKGLVLLSSPPAQEESGRAGGGPKETSTALMGGGGAVDTRGCLTSLIYSTMTVITAPALWGCCEAVLR